MQISAIVAPAKTAVPILPIQFFPKYENNPNSAKIKAKTPEVISPELNSDPVMPFIMPRSLKALFVQLNWG